MDGWQTDRSVITTGFEHNCQSVQPSVSNRKLCTRTDWHHHYIIFFHIRWVLFPAEVSSGSQSIWQAKGQKQEREIENSSSCQKSFVHWRNSKNPRPHGGVQTWCMYGMGVAHSLTRWEEWDGLKGRLGGGGVSAQSCHRLIGQNIYYFTRVGVWWDSGNWLCMPEFSIIVFLLRTLAPLWWQFFFPPDTHKHTHSSLRPPPLCVCRVC
jgi:hypothetical protein